MRQTLLALILAFPVSAQVRDSSAYMENGLDDLLRSGIDVIMREEFAAADSIFVLLSETYPAHPAGPVMRAAVLHLEAEDGLAGTDVAHLEALHEQAEQRAESYRTDDALGRGALSFLASSRGIMSLEAAHAGAWFKALRYALDAASLGEQILEADSTMADAGLAVGSYYYWKSRRVEVIMWLPFVTDSREEGMELLRACAQSGMYQRYAAINSLGWILRDAGKIAEARYWVERGLADYPGNRALLRSYAAVLEKDGDLDGAIRAWEAVGRSYGRDGGATAWGAFEAGVRTAELLGRLQDSARVREHVALLGAMERRLDRTVLSGRREGLLERSARLQREWPLGSGRDPAVSR